MNLALPPFLLCFIFTSALALDPLESKIFSKRADGNTNDDSFGLSMAGSDRWLVVGEPGNDEKGDDAGAAYLYDANTGAFKRKLLASDGVAGDTFGTAVAVSGNRIVVGAPNKNGSRGIAYLFDATSGRELGKMDSTTASPGDFLGAAVAIEADVIVVGVPGDDGNLGAIHGYVIVGLAASPNELIKLIASPRVIDSGFGFSVATDGRFVVTGAPSDASERGSVHVFNLSPSAQLHKIIAGASAGDRLGQRVGLSSGRVYASRPNALAEAGTVNIYDIVSGAVINTVVSPESGAGSQFGFGMAVRENLLLVGQPEENNNGAGKIFAFDRDGRDALELNATDGTNDDKLGSTVAIGGSASVFASADPGGNAIVYRFSKVAPPTYDTLSAGLSVGDVAPGVGATAFSKVTSAVIGDNLLFQASAGKVTGVWDQFDQGLQPTILSSSNLSPLTGVELFAKGFGIPFANDAGVALMPISFTAAAVPVGNPQALLVKTGSLFFTLARLGNTFNTVSFGGSGSVTLASMPQVAQSTDPVGHRLAIASKLKTGLSGVTATTDSAVLVLDTSGNLDAANQENSFLPGTGGPTRLGQISPRVAFVNKTYIFHSLIQSTVVKEGLFLGTFNPGPGVLGAQLSAQGDTVSGAQINRYLGEAISGDEKTAFRAQVLGTAITKANDEMLISNRFGPLENVFQKGTAIGTAIFPSGTVVSKFLRFWSLNGGQVVALIQLRGPFINASNDIALVLANETSGSFFNLLEEGFIAPGCDGTTINTIQSVEIDAEGRHYFILASLKGAVPGQDQALFTGTLVDAPLAKVALRRPFLELRKGSLFRTQFGSQAKITSMAFGTKSSDATGASEKGLPTAIGANRRAAMILRFSDNSTQAVELGLD